VYESACIWVAWKYQVELGITEEQACNVALPYWDWLLDADYDPNDGQCPVTSNPPSQIWDADCFGSQKTDPSNGYYVTDGIPARSGWKTVQKTSDNWNSPSSQAGHFDNKLKRELYCGADGYNLNIGPNQCMESVLSKTNYKSFATWIEGVGHGYPHMLVGFSMSLMFSPDDPLFWLHHCNVDRIWHFWIDCMGFERVAATKLTSSQYTAYTNVRNDLSTNYGSSMEIPYKWGTSTTTLFPKDKLTGKWPTVPQLWPTGLDGVVGWDKISYQYGVDQLVRSFGKSCPDQTWSIVDAGFNAGSKKRDDDGLHPMMQVLKDKFEARLREGQTHREVIHEMAFAECKSTPKNEITPHLQQWIEMNHLSPEQFDTMCDKPSERMGQVTESTRKNINLTASESRTPLWVIIVASVSCAIILIAIIALVIIAVRRKAQVSEGKDVAYRQM
jgi:hypothetical protein